MIFRSVATDELPLFGGPTDYWPDLSAQVSAYWADGSSRPEWCFVAEDDDGLVARLAFVVTLDPDAPVVSRHPDADLLAVTLAALPVELTVAALAFRPDPAGIRAATDLLSEAVRRLNVPAGTVIEARGNPEVHANIAGRRQVFEGAGLTLFQEKEGDSWVSAPVAPHGLRLATLTEVGPTAFAATMSAAGADTLDRNDAYYYQRCGGPGWARVMLEYAEPDDESGWCLASDPTGQLVGYVAVSRFDESGTATITHVGVLPGQRGHGYGRRLVIAATDLAQRAGYTGMLDTVDVVNAPMMQAFLAAGYRDDVRPWHVWHYRTSIV